MSPRRSTDTPFADEQETSGPRPTRLSGVGTDTDCRHPSERVTLLGTVGLVSYYQCERCGGALIAW